MFRVLIKESFKSIFFKKKNLKQSLQNFVRWLFQMVFATQCKQEQLDQQLQSLESSTGTLSTVLQTSYKFSCFLTPVASLTLTILLPSDPVEMARSAFRANSDQSQCWAAIWVPIRAAINAGLLRQVNEVNGQEDDEEGVKCVFRH